MASKHLVLALLGTALASAPALAQTQPSSSSASPSAAASSMSSGNWMTQEQPGQWRASKLEGLDVYNNNNEKVGDISEILVDQSGKIQAVVVGVGGFLGMGEHDVAVPFDQIKFVNEPRANATASNTTTGTAGMSGNNAGTTAGTTTTAPATTGSTASSTASNANAANANANRSAPDHAMLDMTKDQLKAAPEFKYSR
ncbi:PRC-barrel domain-containing protein [Microvirga sp. HBU67558]|uniref:PRC-barrel domain-containing protein n=1 Tax=Microvirga TaxID=186650 RepID=UPI001B39AEF7|nr:MULTISPECIES: PRC-barrel domain-containing protein [unclassified Microvirga]MBQ0819718.1 PRC-barrel domain-containing protein [Microvirga sp. HBU67558]